VADRCMVSNCMNPPGAGTNMAVEVPQWNDGRMTFTGQVCEDHWFGNWHRERRQLAAENALLRRRLDAIAALASDESGTTP
jgi:hypothetical protein